MLLLILGCVLAIASAVTGVQSFYWSSHNGTVDSSVTYWHGPWRWLTLVYAAIFAAAFYGVYRRRPIAWKLGWVFLVIGAAHFIFAAWVGLIHQPYGWVGAIGATVGGILVLAYWGIWWQRQREYFSPGGPPAGWSPDLSPLRWFGIGMFSIAVVAILVMLILHAFHVI